MTEWRILVRQEADLRESRHLALQEPQQDICVASRIAQSVFLGFKCFLSRVECRRLLVAELKAERRVPFKSVLKPTA